jgi:opacity protein-like surface antigen
MPASSLRAVSARRAGVVAAFLLVASRAAGAAEPTPIKAPLGSRFYGGVDVASVHYDDAYGDVAFNGSSIGLGLYGGFRVNDKLCVELAYNETTAIDKHNVAGSGVVYFNVEPSCTPSPRACCAKSRFATCSICLVTGVCTACSACSTATSIGP